MIIDEEIEDPGYAKFKVFKVFWVADGSVIVYDVNPVRVKGGMHISPFFLCTFDNMSDEAPFGIGSSVVDALKDAIEKWAKYVGDDVDNPFREALNQFKREV